MCIVIEILKFALSDLFTTYAVDDQESSLDNKGNTSRPNYVIGTSM